jgi:hypothetical protein
MKRFVFIILTFIAVSCDSYNDYNFKNAGARYCSCMQEFIPKKEAMSACHKLLIYKNRYYKIFYVDMGSRELRDSVSLETSDSVKKFMSNFDLYTVKHCCADMFGDSCQNILKYVPEYEE